MLGIRTTAIRAVASSKAALEWTVDYVTQRRMFGQTLADFQNTRFKLAEMKAALTAQRVFLDRCIELHLRRALDPVDAAMLKLTTTDRRRQRRGHEADHRPQHAAPQHIPGPGWIARDRRKAGPRPYGLRNRMAIR